MTEAKQKKLEAMGVKFTMTTDKEREEKAEQVRKFEAAKAENKPKGCISEIKSPELRKEKAPEPSVKSSNNSHGSQGTSQPDKPKKEYVPNPNRSKDITWVASQLKGELLEHARLVGKWIWVEFPEKPEQKLIDKLRELGFFWNKSREAWQHNCGVMSSRTSGDPKLTYGVRPLEELEAA